MTLPACIQEKTGALYLLVTLDGSTLRHPYRHVFCRTVHIVSNNYTKVNLSALADAMKVEYDTISQAGLLLQLDCPDLTGNRVIRGAEQGTGYLALHVEALNHVPSAITLE